MVREKVPGREKGRRKEKKERRLRREPRARTRGEGEWTMRHPPRTILQRKRGLSTQERLARIAKRRPGQLKRLVPLQH